MSSTFAYFENGTFTFPCGPSTMVVNALALLDLSYVIATEIYACGRVQHSWRNLAPGGYTKLHLIYTFALMVFGIFVYN